MAKKAEKHKKVTFIVTKSGRKKPRVHFYKEGKPVSTEDINVVYKDSDTGRFVTRSLLRARDARTGEFTTMERTRKHPAAHITERVPSPGYGDVGRIPKDSPIRFRTKSSKKKGNKKK